ncbi:MAG: ABC transporter ATP-binding protein [Rhodospirillales bacterium]|jgi:putative spermidine/putrescine transport system ATP-binding protein|nr:ABC transporter ATP-binding protein [Rhodospirillales bacterium]
MVLEPRTEGGSEHRDRKVWLESCAKHYGSVVALAEVELAVEDGEFLTLLGPSGSGKTTLLNLIAGMVQPTSGRIWIDGADITRVPPSKRGIGMVFQNYALMPHMTVFENIAFPLRVRKMAEAEIRRKVGEVLDIVRLPDVGKRKPSELSGGQQQRIAIARCIVYNPSIILMDEPLGALDKKLREELQLELKQLHTQLGITVLYVTHDQEEALTMSDRIVLLNHGKIEQMGPPDELYFQPRTLFAAEFLGDSNIFDGTVAGLGEFVSVYSEPGASMMARPAPIAEIGKAVKVLVRPENLTLLRQCEESGLANRLSAEMVDSIILGGVIKCYVRLSDDTTVVVQELTKAERAPPPPGSKVSVAWSAEDTLILPAVGGMTEGGGTAAA